MANHGWIITKDYYAERYQEKSSVGTMGPHDISPKIQEQLTKGEGIKFRLLDDDNELLAEGLQIEGDTDGFAPLDDFGMPNWGCTTLMQLIDDEWETL
jgi:hypothetical protein